MTGPLHILGPPTVYITDLSIGSNVVIQSTGYDSDILNLRILSGTSLTNMPWTEAVLLSNTYSNGTNLTEVAVPPEDAQFFRIEQGFF